MTYAADLTRLIELKEAVVGVIGLGYVGLPLCEALHAGGLEVLGFDTDNEKIEALAEGRSYLRHLGESLAAELQASERFDATTEFARLGEVDVVLVCVPTPLGPHQEPDLSFVHQTAESIGRSLRPGQLVVLESTTYPGTTRDEFLPHVLAASRAMGSELTCGEDFFVAYSPERTDPGNSTHTVRTTPKLVAGLDETSTRIAATLYRQGVDEVVELSSAEVAESAKLLENIFRAVNIALVNEMKTILEPMGVDVWEVVEAAATKPFGFMPFYPGPGLGGHCLPIDPFYMAWKARELGRPTRFIELAGEVNMAMPGWVVQRTRKALDDAGVAIRGARILVLGMAYKPDIDDTRGSPSFELVARLRALGATVAYSDPHIPETKPVRGYDLQLVSQPMSAETIESYDALLIATDHGAFDYGLIARHASIVVDTRNALAGYAGEVRGRVVKA